MPVNARASLMVLAAQLQALQTLIGSIEKRIIKQHRVNEASQRLESIPGIGVIGATAIAATVADPKVFRSGRDFAAWIGLVPREASTGGKAPGAEPKQHDLSGWYRLAVQYGLQDKPSIAKNIKILNELHHDHYMRYPK